MGTPVNHPMADIKRNYLTLAHITGYLCNAHNHGNTQALADNSGVALTAVFLCDHPAGAADRLQV